MSKTYRELFNELDRAIEAFKWEVFTALKMPEINEWLENSWLARLLYRIKRSNTP